MLRADRGAQRLPRVAIQSGRDIHREYFAAAIVDGSDDPIDWWTDRTLKASAKERIHNPVCATQFALEKIIA